MMEKKVLILCILGLVLLQFLWSTPLIGMIEDEQTGNIKNILMRETDSGTTVSSMGENSWGDNTILPESWDWRNANHNGVWGDWTTPAKNQRNRCYVFTVIGALESIVKIREGCSDFTPDLSEQYLISYYTYDDLLKNESGHTTFEECCPYRGIRGIDWKNFFGGSSETPSAWEDYLIPISNFSVEVHTLPPQKPEETRIKLKTMLLEHGPLGLRIYAPGMSMFTVGSLRYWGLRHTGPGDYYSGDAPVGIFNQAVVLVGWQDDSSIAGGGYWIIKNSWGTNWGCEGFFNLEYGSLNSDCGYYIIVDYDADSYNWPPLGKPTLVAPSYVKAGEEYLCTFSSIDPEQNQEDYKGKVYYKFSWGDYTYSDWLGPFESGEKCLASHVWTNNGKYEIKVKGMDDPNGDGDLSDGKETYWLPT